MIHVNKKLDGGLERLYSPRHKSHRSFQTGVFPPPRRLLPHDLQPLRSKDAKHHTEAASAPLIRGGLGGCLISAQSVLKIEWQGKERGGHGLWCIECARGTWKHGREIC